MTDDDLENNKRVWDRLTPIHFDSDFYDLASFLNGRCTLKRPELELVGPPQGKRILHLQCHFGLDSISWARRGGIVTGVDFSDRYGIVPCFPTWSFSSLRLRGRPLASATDRFRHCDRNIWSNLLDWGVGGMGAGRLSFTSFWRSLRVG